jgi:hypothetical protein
MAAIEDENERRERLEHYLGCSLQLKLSNASRRWNALCFQSGRHWRGKASASSYSIAEADDVVTGTVTNEPTSARL